jgi:ketol-acid reductoisomerase
MASAREVTVFREDDGDVDVLIGKTLAVVGYGSLGRPLALNLHDATEARVIVGGRPDADLRQAADDGFPAFSIAEATAQADVVLFLVPDEVQPTVFQEHVKPQLRDNAAVVFASGYNLTFEPIAMPPQLDVLLFAPRMLGRGIRQLYLDGEGYISYVSVEQDATGRGLPLLLALAKGAGSLRRGALRITAEEEALLDLFGEQALGPWLGAAMLTCFHVGMEAGLPPEALLLEMYLSGEMSQTFQAMADEGFLRSVQLHGYTAAFGGMIRSMSIDHELLAESMGKVLEEIRSGAFTRRLQEEVEAGYPSRAYLDALRSPENTINQVEDSLRRKLDGAPPGALRA